MSLTQHTRLIWVESPSNPLLKVSDIQGLSKLAHAHQALIAVDNTWPTPVLQNPLDLGADIVVHSTTKYLGGHSDVLGGCIILKASGALAHSHPIYSSTDGRDPIPFRLLAHFQRHPNVAPQGHQTNGECPEIG